MVVTVLNTSKKAVKKSKNVPSLISVLTEKFQFYGYDIIDMKNVYPYNERKTAAYGVKDRRNGNIIAIYSTLQRLKAYLNELTGGVN